MVSISGMRDTISLPSLRMHYSDTGNDDPNASVVVLLHGWPQTSACWDQLLPLLPSRYRLITPDIRGYGLSDKPQDGYSKRRMAADIVELLEALSIERVHLVGHDRGARVAHRFALDHPDRLNTLAVLDIVPTHAMFEADTATAAGYFHWLFHMQHDLPEAMTAGREEQYLRYFFHRWTLRRDRVEPMIGHYIESFTRPGAMRAGFEDYRATWEDLEDDEHDQRAGVLITVPTLALWGDQGLAAGSPVLEKWAHYTENTPGSRTVLRGQPIENCGHFIPEERPEELAWQLRDFWDHHARP